jgi:hypothetical protein
MEETHRSERYVLINFKSGCQIGQTRRINPDILCGMMMDAYLLP